MFADRDDNTPIERALLLGQLSRDLAELGRYKSALSNCEKATTIWRSIAEDGTERKELAISLFYLAVRCSQVGDHAGGVDAAEEAVALERDLLLEGSADDDYGLAVALKCLGDRYIDAGDLSDAERCLAESVMRFESLARIDARHKPDLDATRHNLHITRRNLDQGASNAFSGSKVARALDELRELARVAPELHSAQLAMHLVQYAIARHEDDDHAGARALLTEAIGIYQQLYDASPRRHAHTLARALGVQADFDCQEGRFEDALASGEIAVELLRSVIHTDAAEFGLDFAGIARDLAVTLMRLGEHVEAIEIAREALAVSRTLYDLNVCNETRTHLVGSLLNLAIVRNGAGDNLVAIQELEEAASLARQQPMRNTRDEDLVRVLNSLASILAELGEFDRALIVIEEAESILDTSESLLAGNIFGTAATVYSNLGDISKALDASQRSVGALRAATASDSSEATLSLAVALSNQARRYADVGDLEHAIEVASEALHIRMTIEQPVAEALVARAHYTLAELLDAAGRHEDALQSWIHVARHGNSLLLRMSALRTLLDATHRQAGNDLAATIAEVCDDIAARSMEQLLTVSTQSDRRRLLTMTGDVISDAANFLIRCANRPDLAVAWLDSLVAIEARLVASSRSAKDLSEHELTLLAKQEPRLAWRLRAAVDATRRALSETASANDATSVNESPATVVRAIRRLAGHESFLSSRPFSAICDALGAQRGVFVLGSGEDVDLLMVSNTGAIWTARVEVKARALVDLIKSAHVARNIQARLRLCEIVDELFVPALASLSERAVVLPVGYMTLLPLQSRCAAAGARHSIRLAVPDARRKAVPMGTPDAADGVQVRVVHSHGARQGDIPHRPLFGALAEARDVAQILCERRDTSVTLVEDADIRSVLHSAGACDLLHLACHGLASPLADTELQLSDGMLGFDQLVAAIRDHAPRFVGLAACGSGVSSERLPEQVLGFPSMLQSAGVDAVLATLWPVDDEMARAVVSSTYQRWCEGGIDLLDALCDARDVLVDRDGDATLDAFCVYGDSHLQWTASR